MQSMSELGNGDAPDLGRMTDPLAYVALKAADAG